MPLDLLKTAELPKSFQWLRSVIDTVLEDLKSFGELKIIRKSVRDNPYMQRFLDGEE